MSAWLVLLLLLLLVLIHPGVPARPDDGRAAKGESSALSVEREGVTIRAPALLGDATMARLRPVWRLGLGLSSVTT